MANNSKPQQGLHKLILDGKPECSLKMHIVRPGKPGIVCAQASTLSWTCARSQWQALPCYIIRGLKPHVKSRHSNSFPDLKWIAQPLYTSAEGPALIMNSCRYR